MTRPTIVFGREKKFRLGGTSFPTLEDFFLGPGSRTKYLYDTENRWIGENICNGSGLIEHETRFAYDGDEILMQFDEDFTTSVSSTYATNHPMSNANLSHRYLWQPDAVDQLMADEQVTTPGARGNVVYPLTDQLGTIHDLAVATFNNSTGLMDTTVVNHIVYDAFGNVVSSTNPSSLPTVTCLFGYTGRPTDPAGTGLQNNLNRWYSPQAMRWISQDPIGYDGGDANLYRYCGNSATNEVDPGGTDRWLALEHWWLPHMYIIVDVWSGKKVVEHRRLDYWPAGYCNPYFMQTPFGNVPTPPVDIDPSKVFYHVRSNAAEDSALLNKWVLLSQWWWMGFTPITNCWWASRWWLGYGISDSLSTRVDVPLPPPVAPPAAASGVPNGPKTMEECWEKYGFHCFESGTLVDTPAGKRPIERLAVGERVLAFNLTGAAVVESQVLACHRHETDEIYQLILADEVICVTGEHPFYVVGKGWTRVAELQVGDLFLKKDQRRAELRDITLVKKRVCVYNVTVEGEENYFVGTSEILTHNKPI